MYMLSFSRTSDEFARDFWFLSWTWVHIFQLACTQHICVLLRFCVLFLLRAMTTVLPEGCLGDTREVGIAWSLGKQSRRVLGYPAECSGYPCIEPAVSERAHTAPISAMTHRGKQQLPKRWVCKEGLRSSCPHPACLPKHSSTDPSPSQTQQRTLTHLRMNRFKKRDEDGSDSSSGVEDSVGRKGRVPDSWSLH